MNKSKITLKDSTLSVVIPEKLDITNSQDILSSALNILDQKNVENVIFDMKECDYISSAGIGILANITREAKAKGIKTKLVNFSESIKQILIVTDILRYIGTD